MEQITANQYNTHTRVANTERYRISYLIHEMTKEEIEEKLQLEERTRERHKAIRDVIDTYLVAAAEQLRIVAGTPTEETAATAIESLDQLRDFINDCFRNVHKAYGCTVPFISTSWIGVESYTSTIERKRLKQEALEGADEMLVKMKAANEKRRQTIRLLRQEVNTAIAYYRERGQHNYYARPEYATIMASIQRKERRYFELEQQIHDRREALKTIAVANAATTA